MTYWAKRGSTPVKSKSELKRLVAEQAVGLWFSNENLHGDGADVRLDAFPPGKKLNCVGPDPYRDRRWYATVYLNSKGKVTVT